MFYFHSLDGSTTTPNSVEYGNSKTTILLPSAKCMRPLFQGRTGCGGRPSGWHDIITCQRLVSNILINHYTIYTTAYIAQNHTYSLSGRCVCLFEYIFSQNAFIMCLHKNHATTITRSPASAGIANRPLVFATRTTLSGHNIEYLCLNLFTLRRFSNNESSGGRQIRFCPY